MRVGILAWLIAASLPALSTANETSPQLTVTIADGNPWDRIGLRVTGTCKALSGALEIDFTNAHGRFLIDTVYGGPGTKDPMPVKVLSGLISVAPVVDGARGLTMQIGAIAPGTQAIVGLDLDNEQGFWQWQRVEIDRIGLAGTSVTFRAGNFSNEVTFGDSGQAVITLPASVCEQEPPRGTTVPMS